MNQHIDLLQQTASALLNTQPTSKVNENLAQAAVNVEYAKFELTRAIWKAAADRGIAIQPQVASTSVAELHLLSQMLGDIADDIADDAVAASVNRKAIRATQLAANALKLIA